MPRQRRPVITQLLDRPLLWILVAACGLFGGVLLASGVLVLLADLFGTRDRLIGGIAVSFLVVGAALVVFSRMTIRRHVAQAERHGQGREPVGPAPDRKDRSEGAR